MAIAFFAQTSGHWGNPTLIFLHGFLGDRRDFTPVIQYLKTHFYCIAVDLPGHGQTQVLGGEDDYRLENTAQALIEWLPQLAPPPWHLWGYSMGGRLALYLALTFPGYFRKIILESASPGLKSLQEREDRIQRDHDWIEQLQTQPLALFLQTWYEQEIFASFQSHPDRLTILARRLENSSQGLINSLRYLGTGEHPPLWEQLSSSPLPTLLLTGDQDRKFCQINQEMANLMPLSTFYPVANSGHNLHLEIAHGVAPIVQDFLSFSPKSSLAQPCPH